jgi:oxygen-independent coproporphyrinogen-3 oxidase
MNYWNDGEYMGIGPAAWSYVNGERYKNIAALYDYAAASESGDCVEISERLDAGASSRMAAVLALRTRNGIRWAEFRRKYGDEFSDELREKLEGFPDGLVKNGEDRTALTPKGLRLGNSIWSEII